MCLVNHFCVDLAIILEDQKTNSFQLTDRFDKITEYNDLVFQVGEVHTAMLSHRGSEDLWKSNLPTVSHIFHHT